MDINSELKDAQLEILDADKNYSANTKGLIWFNRAANKVKAVYNSVVEILATESWVTERIEDKTNDLDEEGIITTELVSKPTDPSSGKKKIFSKDDGLYELDSSGVEKKLARSENTFSGIQTYSFNTYFGSNLPGWTNDYAQGVPTVFVDLPDDAVWVFFGEAIFTSFFSSGTSTARNVVGDEMIPIANGDADEYKASARVPSNAGSYMGTGDFKLTGSFRYREVRLEGKLLVFLRDS